MGAATYVGRVGGLAVALGVGSAVFAGQGVAWADDTDSSPSKSSTSATSNDDTGDRTTAGKRDDAKESADTDDDAESDDDTDEDADDAEPDDDEPDADEDEDEGADEDEDTEPELDDSDDVDPDDDPEPEDPAPVDEAEPEPDDDTAPQTDTDTPATPAATKRSQTVTADKSATEKSTTTTVETSDDPAVVPKEPAKVAVFASAGTLANSSPAAVSPTVAALLSTPPSTTSTPKPNLVTAVVNVVNSMLDWARQKADATPESAPQPPFLWALMSFARRELENLFVSRSTVSAAQASVVAPTSLALTTAEATTAAAWVPYSPWLNPQVSPSTNFVSWVTGKNVYNDETMANTLARYQIYGTDVGVMWDNGIPDDPSTPWNENQVLIAVGDSFGSANMSGRWIYNTLFRSSDDDLSDGMTIPDGEWFNGNMFGGAPLSGPTQARPIINRPSWLPNSVTLIPTAGLSLSTPDTEFGATQYVSFMSVSNWGSAGRWSTNYSAIAYSTDNGENFTIAPESVRYNSIFSGNRNFQQSAFVKGDDGYVYSYGTPNGRQGAAYISRVAEADILDVSKYEYYKKASSGWFGSSPARWVKGSPSSASAIIGKSGGACGQTKPGYTVSEMSVQYNDYLQKYIVLYGDQSNNIVMRTSDTPEGEWSEATVLMGQQTGGIYAPMMHPWSPSTVGTGSDLYWNLSLWSEYNIMLMRTDLTKL
ncbi:MAG: DUF4185 domain-containing protein [Mycobacterium sp.]